MRKLLALSAFFIAVLTSCNNDDDKKKDKDDNQSIAKPTYNFDFVDTFFKSATQIRGLENIYIPTDIAKKMVNTFDTNYRRYADGTPINTFQVKYWLDACTVKELYSYLSKNKNDGLRVHFGCSTTSSGTKKPFEFNTSIHLFATNFDSTILSPKSQHVDDDAGISLDLSNCDKNSVTYFDSKKNVKSFIDKYIAIYYQNLTDINNNKVLSKSIWIGAETVQLLNYMLDNNKDKLDGINLLTAAYRGDDGVKPPPSSWKKKQSTIIIVPTKKGNAHDSDWDVITALIDKVRSKGYDKTFILGGFNHGELCPQICQ